MKVCIIDLETTGTDASRHEIIEIGAVIFDSAFPKYVHTFDMKVKPVHLETGDPGAFKVNGYVKEEWENAHSLQFALQALQQVAHGCVFMAYNVCFDWSFIEAGYKTVGLRNPFNYHKLCLMTYAWAKMPQATSLKLRDMCTALGIAPEPEVHRALNGAKRAFEVYKKLIVM